jgi:hypothetical protein
VGLMRHVRQGSEISLKYSFQESKFGQYWFFRKKVRLKHPEAKRLYF